MKKLIKVIEVIGAIILAGVVAFLFYFVKEPKAKK